MILKTGSISLTSENSIASYWWYTCTCRIAYPFLFFFDLLYKQFNLKCWQIYHPPEGLSAADYLPTIMSATNQWTPFSIDINFHVPLDCADRFLFSLQSWTRWYELKIRNYPPYNSTSHRKIQTKRLPFSLVALFPFHFPSYTSSLAIQMHTLGRWLNTNKNINYQ